MTSHYLKLKDVKKLHIRDDFSEVWIHTQKSSSSCYIFEDQYEVIEELDYYKREYAKQAALEEARRKNIKLASMKQAAMRIQQ